MSDEPKKKAMDLDGDGKVTLNEAIQYTKDKAGEIAGKAKVKLDELGEEAKEEFAELKEEAAVVAGKVAAEHEYFALVELADKVGGKAGFHCGCHLRREKKSLASNRGRATTCTGEAMEAASLSPWPRVMPFSAKALS